VSVYFILQIYTLPHTHTHTHTHIHNYTRVLCRLRVKTHKWRVDFWHQETGMWLRSQVPS